MPRKTGHILAFEDLYKGMPSVLKSKVKLSSFCLNFFFLFHQQCLLYLNLSFFCTVGYLSKYRHVPEVYSTVTP